MKVIIVLSFVSLVFAATPSASYTSDSKNAKLLLYENENTGFGPYRFAYEQSDGTNHEQQGDLVDDGRGNTRLVVRGKYTFIAPDNVVYVVTYVADELGYRPEIEISEQKKIVAGVLSIPPVDLLIPSMLG